MSLLHCFQLSTCQTQLANNRMFCFFTQCPNFYGIWVVQTQKHSSAVSLKNTLLTKTASTQCLFNPVFPRYTIPLCVTCTVVLTDESKSVLTMTTFLLCVCLGTCWLNCGCLRRHLKRERERHTHTHTPTHTHTHTGDEHTLQPDTAWSLHSNPAEFCGMVHPTVPTFQSVSRDVVNKSTRLSALISLRPIPVKGCVRRLITENPIL